MKIETKAVLGLSALALVANANAGDMGMVAPAEASRTIPFVSLEGMGTWIDTSNAIAFNNNPILQGDTNRFGGRLAAGIAYSYTDTIDLSAETAWDYFGNYRGTGQYYNFKYSIYGADLLVGLTYRPNQGWFETHQLGWFAKVGTLFQNDAIQINVPNLSNFNITSFGAVVNGSSQPGKLVKGSIMTKANFTSILPEIKLGVLYDINPQWTASLAYMGAYGENNPALNINLTNGINVGANLQGPTLNSVLLGIQYNFV